MKLLWLWPVSSSLARARDSLVSSAASNIETINSILLNFHFMQKKKSLLFSIPSRNLPLLCLTQCAVNVTSVRKASRRMKNNRKNICSAKPVCQHFNCFSVFSICARYNNIVKSVVEKLMQVSFPLWWILCVFHNDEGSWDVGWARKTIDQWPKTESYILSAPSACRVRMLWVIVEFTELSDIWEFLLQTRAQQPSNATGEATESFD